MSFCQTCGAAFANGATYCPNCSQRGPAVAASSGLQPNVAGALAYVFGLITAIIFLVIDPYKNDRFVRFHAFQSLFFNLAWIALWIVWGIAGLILGAVTKGFFLVLQLPIDLVFMVGGFALWAFLMYSAYQHKLTKLPVIGALAAKQAGV